MAAQIAPEDQRAELADQRRRVDFDTYDVTVDELLRRVARKRIDIAPMSVIQNPHVIEKKKSARAASNASW